MAVVPPPVSISPQMSSLSLLNTQIVSVPRYVSPNIIGHETNKQLTCAKIGKGHRLAVHTQSKAFVSKHGSRLQESTVTGEFQVLPGFSESLLPALVSRHQGCITGTGNIFPKTIRKLYDQSIAGLKGDASALAEAMVLQDRSRLFLCLSFLFS